jgi:hypothetical protein
LEDVNFHLRSGATRPQASTAKRPKPQKGGDRKTAREKEYLLSLPHGLGGAQVNDPGWHCFEEKYATCPWFKNEWWAYRTTSHDGVHDKLLWCMLKEKCFYLTEKYIAEVLDPRIKFQKYIIEHTAIGEFYSLLRSALMGTKGKE